MTLIDKHVYPFMVQIGRSYQEVLFYASLNSSNQCRRNTDYDTYSERTVKTTSMARRMRRGRAVRHTATSRAQERNSLLLQVMAMQCFVGFSTVAQSEQRTGTYRAFQVECLSCLQTSHLLDCANSKLHTTIPIVSSIHKVNLCSILCKHV